MDTTTPGPAGPDDDASGASGVRDLGVIEGREVPGTGVPVQPGEVQGAAPPPESTSTRPPGGGVGSVVARVPGLRTSVTDEVRQALDDIREARRRGPKPNSRPLPAWVGRLAWVLDDAFSVPGTRGRRVGVDGMLTFVPVAGDLAGLGLSIVVVLAGVAAGVSIPTTARMMLNVGLESLVGLVPFGGAVFDMFYKANQRNMRLIERDLADRRSTRRSSSLVLLGAVLTVVVGVLMSLFVVFAGVFLVVAFVSWLVR